MSEFLDSVIPAQPVEATLANPRSLVVLKDFKVGGTAISSWASLHRDTAWVDTEDGSGGMAGRPINVIRQAARLGISKVEFCLKLFKDLSLCNPPRFRFLIVDKVDSFETWADGWALADFRKTAIGNAREYKDITSMAEVPYIGWSKWEEKFNQLWTAARMSAPHVIFICSLRTASSKYGEHGADAGAGMVNSTDLDLQKRQRKIAVGDSDATGLLWRDEKSSDSANWLSFKSRERGAFTGNRIPRLEGTTIKLSWLDKDRKLVVDWDSLYKLPPAAKNEEPPATISQATSTNV